jgi:hypothetical protein
MREISKILTKIYMVFEWHCNLFPFQFLVERHNLTVNLFREETPGDVQTAVVACTEIMDSSLLVEAAAAGMV